MWASIKYCIWPRRLLRNMTLIQRHRDACTHGCIAPGIYLAADEHVDLEAVAKRKITFFSLQEAAYIASLHTRKR